MYRAYFNRNNDFPLVWSVDNGNQATEQNVRRIVLRGVRAYTEYEPTKGDNVKSPTTWICVFGKLTIKEDVAYFT